MASALPSELDVEALSRRFRPALMAFFVRRLRDHAEAEDLTQDVLLRLSAHQADINADQPDPYVFQMAANLLRDRARKQAVRARYGAGQGVEQDDAEQNEERDPARVLQARQSLAAVLGALKELPERTRSIFILYRLERLKQREIADMYGITNRAVEKQVVKASLHLKARLGEDL